MAAASLRRYPADVARAFSHAPLEVLCALVVAAGFSWVVEAGGGEPFRTWWKVVLIVLPVAGIAWTGTSLHALGDWSSRRRWAVSAAGALAALAYGAFALDMHREAQVWRAAVLGAAVLLLAASAPALGLGARAEKEHALLRFRRFGGRLVLRVLGGALYGGALFVGLALALAAVDSLFELQLEDEIYAHVFGWIAFAVVPWIVVGGLPELVRPLEERGETMALLHRVAAWLVLPLLAVYYGILYAYFVRIVLLGEFPSNLVSPLVGAAAALAAVALTLFDRGPADSLGGKALRFTPVLLLPLVALGVYAVAVRVGQYGWTEFRYVRTWLFLGLGGMSLGAAFQAWARRTFSVHLVPGVLAAVLAVSVLGPWGAPSMARRSQEARLVAGLTEVGFPVDGSLQLDTVAETMDVSAEVYDRIGGSSRFLVAHFGRDAVTPPLPEGLVPEEPRERDIPTALGLTRLTPLGVRVVRRGTLARGESVQVGDARVMHVQLPGNAADSLASEGGSLAPDSTTLIVRTGDAVLEADLMPLIAWLTLQDEGPPTPFPPDRAVVPLTDEEGRLRGGTIVLDLTVEGIEGLSVSYLDAVVWIE